MNLRDLLLIVAAACLIAAGFVMAVPLGLVAVAAVCVVAWVLMGDVT